MRKILYVMALLPVLPLLSYVSSPFSGEKMSVSTPKKISMDYDEWRLSGTGLSKDAFDKGVKGYDYLMRQGMITNDKVITIIDYSRPSTQKRLFVLDMNRGKILCNTLVAHGRNSGGVYATDFSNEEASNKSSLGFFITQNTYSGANGYSLKLVGCEKGINDHAMNRAIVMHGAAYVSEAFIRNSGYLGRSLGCPAVPLSEHKKIIDIIRNGSCLFLYYPAKKFYKGSKILDS